MPVQAVPTFAQLANDAALALNQKQVAQLSCIAGVGGNVKPLVKLAKSGRQIIALDDCNLQCVHHCLKKYDLFVKANQHFGSWKKRLFQSEFIKLISIRKKLER